MNVRYSCVKRCRFKNARCQTEAEYRKSRGYLVNSSSLFHQCDWIIDCYQMTMIGKNFYLNKHTPANMLAAGSNASNKLSRCVGFAKKPKLAVVASSGSKQR